MAFENCELNENELRSYIPGYPWQSWLHGEFMPSVGTIDRENDIRLLKYGNGLVDEPSDLFQFVFDYKGFPLRVESKKVLGEHDVYWCGCSIEHVKDFPYDYEEVKQALRDAMTVYAFGGYHFKEENEEMTVHIEF